MNDVTLKRQGPQTVFTGAHYVQLLIVGCLTAIVIQWVVWITKSIGKAQ